MNPLLLDGLGQLPIFRPFRFSLSGHTRNRDGLGDVVVSFSCLTRRSDAYFDVLDAFTMHPSGESWEDSKSSNGPCGVSLKITIGVGCVVTSSNGFVEMGEGATLGDLVIELRQSHRSAHAMLAGRS